MTPSRGSLCLVLHAHMPYVEGFGTWPFGEEWLWEVLACAYLPLLGALRDAPVTLELSPVLCDQLELLTADAGERFVSFATDIRASLCEAEARERKRSREFELATELHNLGCDWEASARSLEALDGDVIGALTALCASGSPELWTSAATHPILPLVVTDAARGLQVRCGITSHTQRFGFWHGGFWLPECGYAPGLEHLLAASGVAAFCVDQTDVFGEGALEQLEPVITGSGAVAVPIDWQTAARVWDNSHGYPSHPAYRDFHAKTARDLRPWANSGEPYDRAKAQDVARQHARAFVSHAIERLGDYYAATGRPGLCCAAFDAELFGHFWYEGPWWLQAVFEEASLQGLSLAPVTEALSDVHLTERPLAAASWGAGRDFRTWDGSAVADTALATRRSELRLLRECGFGARPCAALERAARELMALQASDWGFLITRGLAAEYPFERLRAHGKALDTALGALGNCAPVPEPSLRNLAPALDLVPLLEA